MCFVYILWLVGGAVMIFLYIASDEARDVYLMLNVYIACDTFHTS